jgi:peptidyl-prolyl cis-trans isomerase D
MMVKPFEDAVFSQKEGEISGVVESDFGYHIIKLTGLREAKERPLQEVRSEIESELKRQAATRQFAEAAENFNNLVYDEYGSLQPAADKFKLEIQKTGWIPKNADGETRAGLGALNNDKVLSALFSEDAVKNQRNTEAIEVASNTLVSARVTEHAAATIQPFETVRDDIEKYLKNEEAMKQARTDGEARLAELEKGNDGIAWPEAHKISRLQSRQSPLPMTMLRALFKADAQKLPVYLGLSLDDGYSLLKITEVAQTEKIDENQLKALKEQYANIMAQEDFSAYLSSLRSRYKIDINRSLLESRER